MTTTPADPGLLSAAETLHREVGPIDLHVDSIIQQRLFGYDLSKRHRAGVRGQPFFWHADIPRMQDADYGGAALGIHYWPWESERGFREMLAQLDYLDEIAEQDARCLRVREPADFDRAKELGLVALSPGVEGAHMLNGELERVATLAKRGVTYLTLTHFSKNAAGTPSMGRGANERDGLTSFGLSLIEALNDAGIVVDVAHVNTPGVLDACRVTRAPVFCTHTGVKAVHDSPRNITDEEIDAIAETGGAIGIIFGPGFLAGRMRADSSVVADHAMHVIDRVGPDHLCIGTDYDGWLPAIPNDQRDCRDLVRFTLELLRRGISEASLEKVLRRNALRVIRNAWSERRAA